MASGSKILVVDDSEIVLEWTRRVLEGAGYAVTTHSSAIGVSVLLLRQKPELVLLDVAMPVLEGDELMEVIRKNQGGGRAKVFLYSDRPAAELRERATRSGCHGFIQKTSDEERFLADVEKALQGSVGAPA